ncbi:unnamed protein product [Owenia fusiformis]|uniref:CUB domain-containing protein n=1 Tax=Owenia fusiformis TaxID=6347 RepID=A0A8S4N8W4_OWEFU|nr:unnamed protein product [Owenia fusiformis]
MNLGNHLTLLATILGELVYLCTGIKCPSDKVTLQGTSEVQTISSPNYPSNYEAAQLCKWLIKSDKSYEMIQFRFKDLKLQDSGSCVYDYLEILDGDGLYSRTLRKLCGLDTPTYTVSSSSNEALVVFRADNQFEDNGFELEYWTMPKMFEEFKDIQYGLANYICFGICVLLLISLIITITFVCIDNGRTVRKRQRLMLQRQKSELDILERLESISRRTSRIAIHKTSTALLTSSTDC